MAAGVNGSMKYTETIAISVTATRFIHLYFLPSVHGPGRNESPARQRSQIGIPNAMYRPMTATGPGSAARRRPGHGYVLVDSRNRPLSRGGLRLPGGRGPAWRFRGRVSWRGRSGGPSWAG